MNKPRYLFLVIALAAACCYERQKRSDPCRDTRLGIGTVCPHPGHEMLVKDGTVLCLCPRPDRASSSSDAEGNVKW